MRYTERQLQGHCGAASLAYCIYAVTGRDVAQREVARAAGRPRLIHLVGLDMVHLQRAARAYGLHTQVLAVKEESEGDRFIRALVAHLSTGPAVLSVDNGDHWVALLGMAEDFGEDFIEVADPIEARVIPWIPQLLLYRCWDRHEHNYAALAITRPPPLKKEVPGIGL